MKIIRTFLYATMFVIAILLSLNINNVNTVYSSSLHIAAETEIGDEGSYEGKGITTVNMEECERTDTLGWIFCSGANIVTGLIDALINQFIVSLLQWRLII